MCYSEGHLDAGALEWIVSVAGTLQLSSTWQPVLGVVGKGRPSGKKTDQTYFAVGRPLNFIFASGMCVYV